MWIHKKAGFTLIELLIVVAIIGILAAIAVPNFMNAQIRAKVAKANSEMRSLGTAVEMYRLDNNVYPCDGQEPNCKWDWVTQSWRLTSPIAYIASLPIDPWAKDTPWGDKAVQHYWYNTLEGYGTARASSRQTSVKGRNNVRLFDPPRNSFRFAFVSPSTDKCWNGINPISPSLLAVMPVMCFTTNPRMESRPLETYICLDRAMLTIRHQILNNHQMIAR